MDECHQDCHQLEHQTWGHGGAELKGISGTHCQRLVPQRERRAWILETYVP
jgi:hypothetical protein